MSAKDKRELDVALDHDLVKDRMKFYLAWLDREPVRAGEPKNHGSSVNAFLDTAEKLADDYEPTGIIIKR